MGQTDALSCNQAYVECLSMITEQSITLHDHEVGDVHLPGICHDANQYGQGLMPSFIRILFAGCLLLQ